MVPRWAGKCCYKTGTKSEIFFSLPVMGMNRATAQQTLYGSSDAGFLCGLLPQHWGISKGKSNYGCQNTLQRAQPFLAPKSPAALPRIPPSPPPQVSHRGLSCPSSPEHVSLAEEKPAAIYRLTQITGGVGFGGTETAMLGSRMLPDHSSCCFPG